jgi:ketosteroid isomerase-like protein
MSSTINDTHAQNLATARRYLAAIEQRDDMATIAEYLHPAIVQEEFPNRLNPRGGRSDYDTMLSRMAKGRQLLSAERYEILAELAVDDRVALEVLWSGTLAVPLGDQLAAGSTIRARFGVFLNFQDGRIIAQRNYDCFEPW